MSIISLAELAITGWRNGRGRRAVIADGDGWSVSYAWIDTDAAFSDFPGHDRTTVLLLGGGFRLHNEVQDTLEFPTAGTAHSYCGDSHYRAELLAGGCQVLNVITRRDTWCHRLHIGSQLLVGQAAVIVSGAVHDGAQSAGPGDVVLPPHDGRTATQLTAITPLISSVLSSVDPGPAGVRLGRDATPDTWFVQPWSVDD